jgi:hypothetical protein
VIAGKAAGCCVAAITTSFPEDLLLKNGADHVVAGNSNPMLSHGPRESLTNALIQYRG